MWAEYQSQVVHLTWAECHRARKHKQLLSMKFLTWKKIQDYQPIFNLLHIACYWHVAVVCLSWKSRGNWLAILFLLRKKFHAKQIFVVTGFIKLGHGSLDGSHYTGVQLYEMGTRLWLCDVISLTPKEAIWDWGRPPPLAVAAPTRPRLGLDGDSIRVKEGWICSKLYTMYTEKKTNK